jgi:hypothetical protein
VLLAQRAPSDELVPERLASRLSLDELLVGRTIADVGLDLVEFAVGRERRRGALVAAVERLHEVPARVHIATTLDEIRALEAGVEHVRPVGDGEAGAQRQHVLGAHLAGELAGLLERRHELVRRDHLVAVDAMRPGPRVLDEDRRE